MYNCNRIASGLWRSSSWCSSNNRRGFGYSFRYLVPQSLHHPNNVFHTQHCVFMTIKLADTIIYVNASSQKRCKISRNFMLSDAPKHIHRLGEVRENISTAMRGKKLVFKACEHKKFPDTYICPCNDQSKAFLWQLMFPTKTVSRPLEPAFLPF